MQEVFEKIIEKLENELKLADEEKLRCARENPLQFDSAKGYANGVANSIEIVKKVAAEYNDGWIPADKLPKDNNYVLLSFENFSLPMVGRYESDGKGGGSYYIGDCDEEDTCIANDLYVNAWQPLPDPYRPCTNTECAYYSGNECAASEGCAGYQPKGE